MQSLGNKNRPKFQPLANLGPSGIEFICFFRFFCKIQHFGGELPPRIERAEIQTDTRVCSRALVLLRAQYLQFATDCCRIATELPWD